MNNLRQKVAVYLGLAEDEEYDGYPYDEQDRGERRPTDDAAASADPVAVNRSAHGRQTPSRPAGRRIDSSYDVVAVTPTSYSDAARIGQSFRTGDVIAMDLSRLNPEDAKRMIDFSSGLTYGLDGTIKRLAGKMFLLTPKGVVVADSVQADLTASS